MSSCEKGRFINVSFFVCCLLDRVVEELSLDSALLRTVSWFFICVLATCVSTAFDGA